MIYKILFTLVILSRVYILTSSKEKYEMWVKGKDNQRYNLAGYTSYKNVIRKINDTISLKMKESFTNILQYTKTNASAVLTFATSGDQFIFLHLLHLISTNDVVFANLILLTSASFAIPSPEDFNKWLIREFNFPNDIIYRLAQNMAKIAENGVINIPRNISNQLVLLTDSYNIFEKGCLQGDVDVLQFLLKSGYNLTKVNSEIFLTVLNKGFDKVTKLLMENDIISKKHIPIDRDLKLPQNQTLLHVAVRVNSIEVVKLLLGEKMFIDLRDVNGRTPLHMAVEADNSYMITFLHENNANLNSILPNTKDSLLHIAVLNGNLKAAKTLLDLGITVNSKNIYGETPIFIAVKLNNTNLVTLLLAKQANLNEANIDGQTPLYKAVENGNVEIINQIIQLKKTDLIKLMGVQTTSGDSLMHIAAAKGNLDVIRLILNNRAPIELMNQLGHTPIFIACQTGRTVLEEILGHFGPNNREKLLYLNKRGLTMLHEAALIGHLSAVETLVELNVDIDVKGMWSATPLHIAARMAHIPVMEFLMKNKANSSALNKSLWTPLHMAVFSGEEAAIHSLLNGGASLHQSDTEILKTFAYRRNLTHYLTLLNLS